MDEWYLREWAGVDPANGSPLWYTTDENGKRTTTDSYNKADRVYCVLPRELSGVGMIHLL